MDSPDLEPAPSSLWSLRRYAAGDRDALLRLNADNRPALAAVDDSTLTELLEFEGFHLVAVDRTGAVVGYLMSFPRESAYDDTEIAELRRRLTEPFFYICQIAIAPEYRRQRIGRAFYAEVENAARRQGVGVLCCDVNIDPPNHASLAFHRRLGFVEIAAGLAGNGTPIVYLVRRW